MINYYLDKLLSWKDSSCTKYKLEDICNVTRGKRVTKNSLTNEGYPVVSSGSGYMGYYKDFNQEGETITIAMYGTAGLVRWHENEFWATDNCSTVEPNELLDKKYLYYFLKNNQSYLYSQVIKDSLQLLPKNKVLGLKINLPPINIQKKIVRVLDKFNNIINDIQIGLPKEKELRKKQYEYYLEKLIQN